MGQNTGGAGRAGTGGTQGLPIGARLVNGFLRGGAAPQIPGGYRVLYRREGTPPWFGFGNLPFTRRGIERTHVEVARMMAGNGEDVFRMLNQDLSPNFRRETRRVNAAHDSMSTGDVVQAPDNNYYVVLESGWARL